MDNTGATTRDVCDHMLDELLYETNRHGKSIRLLGKLTAACGMQGEDAFKFTELLGDHNRQVRRLLSEWQYKLRYEVD